MTISHARFQLHLVFAYLLAACFGLGGCGGSSAVPTPEADASDAGVVERDSSAPVDTGVILSESGLAEHDAPESTVADVIGSDVIASDASDASMPACSLPVAGMLALPTSTVMGTLRGASLNTTTSCTTDLGTQGPEAVYVLDVVQRTGVILRTTASTNTVVAIRRTCDDPVTEVACNNDGPMPPNASLRTILDPGRYYVLVDVYAFGIGGDYSLSLESFAPPINGTCSSATPVADGAMVKGDLSTAASPPKPIMCPNVPPMSGNVLYYKATIPAGHRLVANAKGSMGESFVVDLLDSCTSSACLVGGFGRVAFSNDKATARDVIITVSSGRPPVPGGPPVSDSFQLDVSIQPLAANATCSTAKPVSAGMTVTGDTSFGGADTMTGCLVGPFGGNVSGPLWYSVTVAPGQILRVNVTTTDPFMALVGALDGCGAGATCLTPMDRPGPGPVQLRYVNGGTAAQNVLFYVGRGPFDAGGRFSMTVSIDAAAANGNCSMPTPLTDGVPVTGDTTLGTTATIPCFGPSNGTLYYSITVPTAMTLGVELRPTGMWDARIAILDACGANSCLGMPQPGGPIPIATYTNTTGSPRSVIVVAGSGFGGGAFSLTAALRAPPTNVTCASATPVMNGTSLTFQDASAGGDNLSNRCIPSDTGGVLYYSATIGAGKALTATATTTGPWLPSLRLLASCSAMTCLASSSGPMPVPMPGPGGTLTYLNAGGSPMDVILAVGPSVMSGPVGYFDLDVSIATPPYAATTTTGACDDMTNAVQVQGVMGKDTASVPAALPFSIAYFGATMTAFSVNSNGFVQFFDAPGGAPPMIPGFFNTPIPVSMPPNGMAALYWDGLNVVDPSTRAQVLTSGTAPNRHFTIEWKNFSLLRDMSSRLTFQAKLFETTNVIEFHYCSLTNATGDTASIGLEDAAGTRGIQIGYWAAGTANTSNAHRFTPAPP